MSQTRIVIGEAFEEVLNRQSIGSHVLSFLQDHTIKPLYLCQGDIALRKRLSPDFRRSVSRVEALGAENRAIPYHCILATNNIDPEYRAQIEPLICAEECAGVFDLSAVPILTHAHKENAIGNMYSETYLAIVGRHNKEKLEAARIARSALKNIKWQEIFNLPLKTRLEYRKLLR